MSHDVLLLGGGFPPVDVMFGPLAAALGDRARVAKDPEAILGERPPDAYRLEDEVAGVARVADAAGFGSFHVVGLSAGASVGLMFAAVHPGRVRSLTLAEPAWVSNEPWSALEARWLDTFDAMLAGPLHEVLVGVARLCLADGVAPPAMPDPPPDWAPRRAEGVRAAWPVWRSTAWDRRWMAGFDRPVYLPVGGRSSERIQNAVTFLAGEFPRAEIEWYAERDHFDLVAAEPDRLAAALLRTWEASAGPGAADHGRTVG